MLRSYRPPRILVLGLVLLAFALLGGAFLRSQPVQRAEAAPLPDLDAQAAGRLSYGTSVIGSVNPGSPVAIYSFNGTEADLVNAQVVGMTPNMTPSIVLLSSNQERLTLNNNDVFSPITGDATLSWFLPYTGLYLLVVTDANSQAVDFVLRLDGRPNVVSPMLQPNIPVRVNIPAGSPVQFFRFQHLSECFSTLTTIPGEPDFPFTAHVRNERGESVAILRGGALREDRVTVPPESGEYEVEIGAATPEDDGYVVLVMTCAEDAPFCNGAADLGPVDIILPGGTLDGTPTAPDLTPTVPTDQPTVTPPSVIVTQPPPVIVTNPPPQRTGPDCGGFQLTSPTDGLPNGGVTVYWDPAPSATGYQVGVVNNDNGMNTGTSTGAGTTSAGVDVSTGVLGEGFTFTVVVNAVLDGTVICSDSATMLRESTPGGGSDTPGNDEPDATAEPMCGNGICEPGESPRSCNNDCP